MIYQINKEIILASASPRRQQIFNELGLQPIIFPVEIDESNHDNLLPEDYVIDLASKKAGAASKEQTDKIVVGADTVVVAENIILEKPLQREDARKMLEMLSGRSHKVITGVNIRYRSLNKIFTEETYVYFKRLSVEEINWYLDSGEPFDKAGSYGIQGLGRVLISKIEGCYFNVVGFPIHHFYIKLKELLEEILESEE